MSKPHLSVFWSFDPLGCEESWTFLHCGLSLYVKASSWITCPNTQARDLMTENIHSKTQNKTCFFWVLPDLIWRWWDCDTPAVWRQSCSAHVCTDSTLGFLIPHRPFKAPVAHFFVLSLTGANVYYSHIKNTCLVGASVNVQDNMYFWYE